MVRSNGKFPNYERLEIDANQWPEAYWDGARQCISCGTMWPLDKVFTPSPCCNARTVKKEEAAPDMRWPDAVKDLLKARFNRWYEGWNEGKTDEDLIVEEETEMIPTTAS